jgi:hypothetical protein
MNKEKAIINNWISSTVKDGSWKNYNDLHIDEINSVYSSPEYWIPAGNRYLEMAIKYRDKNHINFIVALGFSLCSSKTSLGLKCESYEELIPQFDSSPPSLYLFEPSWENWRETEERSSSVEISNLTSLPVKVKYVEFFNVEDLEYRRSLFLISLPN